MKNRRPQGWGLFGVTGPRDIVSGAVSRMRIRFVAHPLNTSDLRREWLHHESRANRAGRIAVLVSRCSLTGLPIVWLPNWIFPSAFAHPWGATGYSPRDARWAVNEALWCPERRKKIINNCADRTAAAAASCKRIHDERNVTG